MRVAFVAAVATALGLLTAPESVAAPAPAPAPEPISASRSGPDGYTVVRIDAATGQQTDLATIRPEGGVDGEDWLGYQCTTGDGAYVVAVVAQRWTVNRHVLRDRGALAYAVRTASGEVTPLSSGVAFKYHTPGCGSGGRAALLRHLGRDQTGTEVLSFDLARGRLDAVHRVRGQLTSAVPLADGTVAAARGASVVGLDGRGREWTVADLRAAGTHPFALRPTAGGGLDLLVADPAAGRTSLVRAAGGSWRALGSGRLADVQLADGPGGSTTVAGLDRPPTGVPGLTAKPAAGGRVLGASATGALLLQPDRAGATAARTVLRADGTSARLEPPTAGRTVTARPVRLTKAGATGWVDSAAAAAAAAPECAVPRNDVYRQVPQPNVAQVDWALQHASRNELAGPNARPAGFLNLGLPAYSPSVDFPRLPLAGGAGAPVPPSVIQGTFAQESNWRHASPRALPGIPGNPNVSDYYGAGGTLDTIDYAQADCGYGLAQVTDPMTASSTQYTAAQKAKVAVDYAANAQAGVSFLVSKWNELHAARITANGGDPRYLENWYFALWAYNTGLNAPDAAGNRGLGWTNNPIQSDYPPNRTPFLRATYADAERPGDWPYQELVIGWMETPLLRDGDPAYQGTGRYLTLPAISRFCDASNDCDPGYLDPSGQGRSYCRLADRHCWWHQPVTFVTGGCTETTCETSRFTVPSGAREPARSVNHPHACQNPMPAGAVVVDNQPGAVNVLGCTSRNWQSQGSFSVRYGSTGAGVPLGEIDWHQLGTGLGGHLWFTKNRAASTDTAHINVGTWTPPATVRGFQEVLVHLPGGGHGAGASASVTYRIWTNDRSYRAVTIDQRRTVNQWVSLGTHEILAGGRVELTSYTVGTAANPSPESGSVNVAYDAVMFVPTHTARLPLIIAHGLNDFPDRVAALELIARTAVGSGLRISRVQLVPAGSIAENAAIIVAEAERLRQETGAPRVNVLGHSKGGLDARRAMWDRPELFNALGMLGTPNLGSTWAEAACQALQNPDLDDAVRENFGTCGPEDALYQLRPAFVADFNRQYPDRLEHRHYVAAGTCALLIYDSPLCTLTTPGLELINLLVGDALCASLDHHDGVVCASSAYGMVAGTQPGAKHLRSGAIFRDHDHFELAWYAATPCPARFVLRDLYGVPIPASCNGFEPGR